jgi:methionine--tRNA ligase beta chain
MEPISIDDFKKVEIKVGEIASAERIEGSEKLLKLKVNFGTSASAEGSGETREERQVLSGIAAFFVDPNELVGKRCLFVTNLAPRMMMGLESQAMIMATGGDENPFVLFETTAAPGSSVR